MANKFVAALALVAGALLAGCVSVENRNGITPPSALCSNVRGTIGTPKGPVAVGDLKSARTGATVHLREWVFTGVSAGLVDMAVQSAVEKSGLKKVSYVDYEQVSYLGFVSVFNITVYGE